MVGGYMILTKKPLKIGENNLVEMYGSLNAVNERLLEATKLGKPILVELLSPQGKSSSWVEYSGISSGIVSLVSDVYNLSYNTSTGVINVTTV